MLDFADRCIKIVEAWSRGDDYEGIKIAPSRTTEELAPLLESRAKLLKEWADDDALWDFE